MEKIRAYKIAEELGLSREDFLARAKEIGIELHSAMIGVDEEQVETLRRRLGGVGLEQREEKRIGSSVIRRRRKKSEPPPVTLEEAPEATAAVPELPGAEPSEPAPVTPPSPEPSEEAEPEPPTPVEVVPPAPPPAIAASGSSAAARPAAGAAPPGTGEMRSPTAARKLARRKVLEGVTLKENEQLSRSLRGNVQRRLEQRRLIVEQQSRLRSARRRPAARGQLAPVVVGPRKKVIRLAGSISFPELSQQTGLKVRDLLRRARALDAEIERDAFLEPETLRLIAEEIGFEVQRTDRNIEETVENATRHTLEGQAPRPPVVTVMGHVDHGKTTLLDAIRHSNVAAGEAGGITQHIGAYQVEVAGAPITFIDTPGHVAFTAMRARGAQITDIAVLVVAAEDGIMPQTVEAIDHARVAGVSILVAINKIDKPDANPQRIKEALLEHQLVPEEFGGETICVELSAKTGLNIDKLLEMLRLQAEILELRARNSGPAVGTVIEAEVDRGRGPMATVLVRQGLLRRGDAVVIGGVCGRVRTLLDDQAAELKEATPSMPVQIFGLSGVPDTGDEMVVVKNEREAKQVVEHRMAEQRRASQVAPINPEDIEDPFLGLASSDHKELRLIVKADVRGTMEAVCDAVTKIGTEEVKVIVLHSGVGPIGESDVTLASASRAMIVGFHIRPEPVARKAAEHHGVEIVTFDIVYELTDEIEQRMLGLTRPREVEHVSGHAEVRELFPIPRVGTVAGSFVPEGAIRRSDLIRVLRDGVLIYSGKLASLRRFKDDVREVQTGMECGMRIENFNDVKVGDILESYWIEEIRATR